MKKFLIFLLSIVASSSLLTSCSEDIDMVGGFTETAVVYGLLDQADSIHFVKITRAFIGPGNSLEIAQIPDSSYFDQVDATITEIVDDVQTRQWVLQDTIVENKETNGVFYAPTQKLYYFITRKCKADGSQQVGTVPSLSSLNKDAIYKINISINGGEFEVSGETELVKGITSPTVDPVTYRYDFIENDGSYANNGIKVNTGNSYVLNTQLEIKFDEIQSGVDTTVRSFIWNLGESEVTPNGFKVFTMNGNSFYNLLFANCTNNALINRRRIHSFKAIMTGGAEELYNYMLVNKPSSSLAQNKPTYTNLTVTGDHRVIGIFSARYTYSVEKFYINPFNNSLRMLTVESVQKLWQLSNAENLNFCSQHPADNGQAWSCQ